MPCPFYWCKNHLSSSMGSGRKWALKKKSKKTHSKFLRPNLYHFLSSYSNEFYIIRKGFSCPFFWCKTLYCSLTGSGTNWALKIYYEFFCFFFFKAHFLPLSIELERWFLHQKKGHGKPFLAYEIQFSISTINSIAGALKICDKCNFQKKI